MRFNAAVLVGRIMLGSGRAGSAAARGAEAAGGGRAAAAGAGGRDAEAARTAAAAATPALSAGNASREGSARFSTPTEPPPPTRAAKVRSFSFCLARFFADLDIPDRLQH